MRDRTETLEAGGIFWRCYGSDTAEESGTPLVILHGLFGAGDNWGSQARALVPGVRGPRPVLVPDLPNHGDSLHTDSFTYPEVAALLWEVLPDVLARVPGASPDVPLELMGHSMGGKIAMAMALGHPERLRRLVVVDIAPRRYAPRHQSILQGMQAVAEAAPESRNAAEQILAEHIPEKAVRLFLLKSLAPAPAGSGTGRSYRWKLNLDGIRRCYESISDWPFDPSRDAPFPGPTLFVRGGMSPYIPEDAEDTIRAFFPRALIRTIAAAGHWVHAEAREEFLSVVRGEDS